MRLVKLIAFLLASLFFFLAALLLHLGLFLAGGRSRWRWISRLITWSYTDLVRAILGVRVVVEGDATELRAGGYFVISNHVGYLDGIVLGSIFPTIFISKKEVRGWPLLGTWTALCGTIYIDRQRKDRIPLLVSEIGEKLGQKTNVLLFPEGTSTNGDRMLPFQSAPFAAPLRAGVTIAPVRLTYRKIDGRRVSAENRDRVYWYGDMEFAGHFWNLLAVRRIEAVVKILPRIETARYKNDSSGRKALSQACHDRIAGFEGRGERREVYPHSLTLS